VQWGKPYYLYETNFPTLNDLVQLDYSETGYFFVGLRSNGTVVAWGRNYEGQCNVPADLKDVVQVIAKGESTLALKSDGTVVGWGDSWMVRNIPSSLSKVVSLATTGGLVVALTSDGKVIEWDPEMINDVPAGLSDVVQIGVGCGNWSSVTGSHADVPATVALQANGKVVVWKQRRYIDEVNKGFNGSSSLVENFPKNGLSNIVKISTSGEDWAVALRSDGTVYQWGNTRAPILWDGSIQEQFANFPTNATSITNVVAGTSGAFLFKSDGAILTTANLTYQEYNSHPHVDRWETKPGAGSIPANLKNILQILPKSGDKKSSLALVYKDAQTISFPQINSVPILEIPKWGVWAGWEWENSGMGYLYGKTNPYLSFKKPTSSLNRNVNISISSGPASYPVNNFVPGSGKDALYLTGRGRVFITATQAGDDYTMPVSVTNSFEIRDYNQTIEPIVGLPNTSYSKDPIKVAIPKSTSGILTTLSVKSGPASLTGDLLTISGTGTVVITANQAGNEFYFPAPEISTNFVVSKASQTIESIKNPSVKTFGGLPFDVNIPSATSELPVSITVKSGPAMISGSTVTLTGAGTVVLSANQAGNVNYQAAPEVTTSFIVSQSPQTINAFTAIPSHAYGDASFSVMSLTASSGLPVDLRVLSGPATISGNTVTLTGVGTVVLGANQSGNNNYTAASEVTTSFSVTQGNQAINFGALNNQTYGDAPFLLGATASSGLPVTYNSTSTNISLSSNVVTILGAGTATITANQSGNINWSVATPVNQNLVINQAPQTINAFTTVANQTFSNGAIVTITPPSASSTMPVTVTVKSGPATISGNTVSLVGAGTVVLAADQAGNANYTAAPQVTTSFSVGSGSQSITFPSIPSQPISTNQITLNASASSELPISYSMVSGAASLTSSNALTLSGIGTITVQATQPGNANWSAATPARQSFVVNKGSQIITFAPLLTNTFGQPSYRLTNASSSSGLPVSYASSVPAVATIVSNALTIVGAGTTTITASQPGNTNWGAATNVARMLIVLKASNTISDFGALTNRSYVPNAIVTLPAPLPTASSRLPVTFSVKSGPAVMSGTNAVNITGGGTVVIAASQAGNTNYLAAPEVTTSFQILAATQSIASFAPIAAKTNGTAPFTVMLPAASSGLPVTLKVLSGPAAISSNTVSLTGAGLVTLAANQGGNNTYMAAPQVTTSFSVAKGNQGITFEALTNRTYGGAPFAIRGMSSSGLPLTYTSSDTNVAIVTTNSVADVVTDLGDIPMELLSQSAPVTVANFVFYADKGAYDNTIFHRSVPGFVIQGGGYVASTNLASISAKAPITNEYSIPNTRGTVSMALVGTNRNSATTQWFINLTNNSSILDNTNTAANPSFAVFARVLGKGLSVVDSISSLPIYNAAAPFNELPTQGVTNGQLNLKISNLVSMDIGIVRGPAVVIVGAGTAKIVASQEGDSNSLAATPMTNSLVVGKAKALVSLSNLRHTYDGVATSVTVTTMPRNLPVTVTYRNGSAVPVDAGNYRVMATVNDSNYSGVATGILAVARKTQTITFAPASSVTFSISGVINLEATSSSELPITYTSSIPAVLSISGSKAHIKKRGSSIITATQAGNTNIAPATSVRKIITVK
jgi:cyclophilin family peptidyl-prolyl cis-trans isomerase